jgi:hypothetical protein
MGLMGKAFESNQVDVEDNAVSHKSVGSFLHWVPPQADSTAPNGMFGVLVETPLCALICRS